MRIFNINNLHLRAISILFICVVIFSCRQIPEEEKIKDENGSFENFALVKINLDKVEFKYNNIQNTPFDENNTWGGVNL